MARGTRIGRIIEYFREGEIEEVEYVLMRASNAVAERKKVTSRTESPRSKARKPRKAKVQDNGASLNMNTQDTQETVAKE
jgi:hypothetical protein